MTTIDAKGALERFDNDTAIYLELVDTFIAAGRPKLESMEGDLAEGKADLVAAVAHKIKGGALTIGATELAQATARLEALCRLPPAERSGDFQQQVGRLITASGAIYDETLIALVELRAHLQTPS